MCFDRNINGNRDVKFFEWDYSRTATEMDGTLTLWSVLSISVAVLGLLVTALKEEFHFI